MCVCASGQWKVKFDPKPKKGLFLKLGGDMVLVPLLYHHKYMAVTKLVVELKAQVTNTNTPIKHSHRQVFKLRGESNGGTRERHEILRDERQ